MSRFPAFSVREWLADELDVDAIAITRGTGPVATVRGMEMEYLVDDAQVVPVIIAWSTPMQYGRPQRVISAKLPSREVIDEVGAELEIAW